MADENPQVWCDQCQNKVTRGAVYHCPKEYHTNQHPQGYDICETCGKVSAASREKKFIFWFIKFLFDRLTFAPQKYF